MNETIGNTPPEPPPLTAGKKLLARFAAAAIVGMTLYVSPFVAQPRAALADEPKTTARAVAAAHAFVAALNDQQRGKATYEFGSPKKSAWSNLPVTLVARNGVRLADLSTEQREKAMTAVASVLSKEGYQKVLDIMDGDQKLVDDAKGGAGKGAMFGANLYYLALFGKPSETEPWMVQFGGHHLGINVTVVGKNFILTPTHTGTQPAVFQRAGKEVRPLGQENDAAFKLVNALDEKQRAQAIIAQRPQQELLLGPGRDDRKPPAPQGVKGSDLTAEQQALLLEVVGAWVNIAEPTAAATRMAAIKQEVGDLYFVWSGPTEKGSAAYFRVQGPTVVIEYAPQGGTGHIHTVIRNPQDEYGAGSVKR